jgi:hypothetical protein
VVWTELREAPRFSWADTLTRALCFLIRARLKQQVPHTPGKGGGIQNDVSGRFLEEWNGSNEEGRMKKEERRRKNEEGRQKLNVKNRTL